MKPNVEQAIEEIRQYFPHSNVETKDDGSGGAYVFVDSVDFGPSYTEETRLTWIGFHLAYNYPLSDIYPHHVRPDLKKINSQPLPEGMHRDRRFDSFGRSSVMISRRTTVAHSWCDQTGLLKLLKIIEWAGGSFERRAA